MPPRGEDVTLTSLVSTPFNLDQLNMQHDTQPSMTYGENTLLQGFASNQGFQQQVSQQFQHNVQSDEMQQQTQQGFEHIEIDDASESSTDLDDSDDIQMFLSNPKMEKKFDKLFSKVSHIFPTKYQSMMDFITTSNAQASAPVQHEVNNLMSFENHTCVVTTQQDIPVTSLETYTSKPLSVNIPPKVTFQTMTNPLYNAPPQIQDQMATMSITIPKTSQVVQSGSQPNMKEKFTIGMPNVSDIPIHTMAQQSSYVLTTNAYAQVTPNIQTRPPIVATKRENHNTQPQQILQQLKSIEQAQVNANLQQQNHVQQQVTIPLAPPQVDANLQHQQFLGQTSQHVVNVLPHIKVKQPKVHKQSFLKLLVASSGTQHVAKPQQVPIQNQQQLQQQYVPQYMQMGQIGYYAPQQQQQANMQVQVKQPQV